MHPQSIRTERSPYKGACAQASSTVSDSGGIEQYPPATDTPPLLAASTSPCAAPVASRWVRSLRLAMTRSPSRRMTSQRSVSS